jgi:hypothetical protein
MDPKCMYFHSKHSQYKPALRQTLESFVVSSSSSRGFIDPSTSVSTGNLVSCLVSCGGFRFDASSLVTMLSVMR